MNLRKNKKKRLLALLMCLLMVTTLIQGNGYSAFASLIQGGSSEEILATGTDAVQEETTEEVTEATTQEAVGQSVEEQPVAVSEELSQEKADSATGDFNNLVTSAVVDPTTELSATDSLSITLNYTLPKVSEDGTDPLATTYIYTFKISDIAAYKDGDSTKIDDFLKAYTETNQPIIMGTERVGTYNITEDGQVTLNFYEGLETLMNSATSRDGMFEFSCDLNQEKVDEEGGTYKLVFKTEKGTAETEITVKPSETVSSDVNVEKAGSSIGTRNDGTHYVTYTVTVENTGTTSASNVVVTDTMKPYLTYNNDATYTGTNATSSSKKSGDDTVATFTIDSLPAGGKTTIIYTCDISDAAYFTSNTSSATGNNEWQTQNVISASVNDKQIYIDEENKNITQTVNTNISKDVVGKTNTTNQETGEMTWTITINAGSSDFDLNGVTISDTLGAGQILKTGADIIVKKGDTDISNDGGIGAALKNSFSSISSENPASYTFNTSTKDIYTITYTTVPDPDITVSGQKTYTNKATATKDGYKDEAPANSLSIGSSLSSKTFVGADKLNADSALGEKYINDYLITEDMIKDDQGLADYKNDLLLPWKTEINVPENSSTLVYTDYVNEQIKTFYPNNASAFTLKIDGGAALDSDDYNVEYTSTYVKITLTESGMKKASGNKVIISYDTIADYASKAINKWTALYYQNSYYLTVDSVNEQGAAAVKVYKTKNPEAESVSKKADGYDKNTHMMKWYIDIDASEDESIDSITLTDSMTDMRYSGYDGWEWDGDTSNMKVKVVAMDGDGIWQEFYPTLTETIVTTGDHPSYKYTLTLDASILAATGNQYGNYYLNNDKTAIDCKLRVYYTTSVDGANLYKNNTSTYSNEVSAEVSYPGDNEVSVQTDEASQTVETNVISKSVGDTDVANLKYTLNVNPGAVKLNPNSEQNFYQVEDTLPSTLVFNTDASSTVVQDKNGNVYERVSDISGVTSAAKGSKVYHVSYKDDILTFTVPDEVSLTITYKVTMLYDDNKTTAEFVNSAKLTEPYVSEESQIVNRTQRKVATSSATISSSFLNIKKVDADDTTKLLAGAEITAKEKYYNGTSWVYTGYEFKAVTVKDSALTDTDFKVSKTPSNDGSKRDNAAISANYIYEISETKAPTGYDKTAKTYSVIYIADDKVDKDTLPSGTLAILAGAPLIFADTAIEVEDTNKLTITKEYYEADGTTKAETPESLAVIEVYNGKYTLSQIEKGTAGSPLTAGNQGNGFTYTKVGDVITLEGLPQGSYTVYESSAPDGYEKLNRVYNFTVAADKTIKWDTDTTGSLTVSKTLKNTKTATADFAINKTYVDAAGRSLTGDDIPEEAVFTYTQTQRYVDGELAVIDPGTTSAVEFTTTDNGVTYTASGLTPGVYEIKEKTSSVYEAWSGVKLNVAKDGTVTVTDSAGKDVTVKDGAIDVKNTVKANKFVINKAYYMIQKIDGKDTQVFTDADKVESGKKVLFTLYKKDATGKYTEVKDKATCETIADKEGSYDSTTQKDVYAYENLIPGDYKVTESLKAGASVDYEQLQTVYFTVNDDYTITTSGSQSETYTKTVDVNNNEQTGPSARFYLQKYVSDYEGNLTRITDSSDASKYTFTITSDDADGDFVNNASKTLTYNPETKRWEIDNLHQGTYEIKETNPDYLEDADTITITVKNGTSTADPCTITSVKYGDDEYIDTVDENEDLWIGKELEEKTETLVVNLVNRPVENEITIQKEYYLGDSDGNNAYTFADGKGSTFSLYSLDGDKQTLVEANDGTDNASTYTFENLNPGEYKIVETAPDGFNTCADIMITVDAEYKITYTSDGSDSSKATVTNITEAPDTTGLELALKVENTLTNSFTFTKKFSNIGGTVLSDEEAQNLCGTNGASFALYDAKHTKLTASVTSDKNVFTVKNLADGTYYIHEETAPDGYKEAADIQLVVADGKISATYVNCPGDSNRKASASDFADLYENNTTKAEATLYNRAKSNSLTISKTYYSAAGTLISYSSLNGTVASFTLTKTDVNPAKTIRVSSVDIYSGTYVYENLESGTYKLSENTMTGFKSIEDVTITVKDGKITYLSDNLGADTKPRWYNPGSGNEKSDAVIGIENQQYGNSFTLSKEYYGTDGKATSPDEKAAFKLTDANGKEIKVTSTSSSGNDYTWKNLEPGTYTLTETSAPAGFKLATGSITLTVASDRTITSSYDGSESEFTRKPSADAGRTESVILRNYQTSNSITIKKSYKDADGNTIAISSLTEAEYPSFVLYKDADDGNASQVSVKYDYNHKSGLYQFSNIPDGTYHISEFSGEGYEDVEDICFTVKDAVITITPTKTATVNTKDSTDTSKVLSLTNTREKMENSITLNKSFMDIDSNLVTTGTDKLLAATSFTMKDANGKAVSKFAAVKDEDGNISYWKAENLEPGTYTITETSTPDGYVAAGNITVTVTRISGTKCSVTVKYKGTNSGDLYMDAVSTSMNYSGTLINHEHVDNILKVDKYFKDSLNQNITDESKIAAYMENTAFTLTGEDGDAVEAYKVSGNKYEWRNLQTGTYTLSESKNDDGFIPVNDITVEVSNDGTITCTGADDKDFESTQTATNHQTTLSLYNYDKSTQVLISKTDINGTEELEGAELKVYRADDETEIVDSWTSTTGSHKINKTSFETDVVYVLEETTSPFGYEVTESIRFKIDTDGNVRLVDENGERLDDDTDENSSIIMKDDYSYLKVLKTRSNLKPLSGAGMQITDANGEVKDSWVSTTEAHLVQIGGNLEKNIEYTLSEVSVPYGYEKAADIKFMLDENENIKVYNASSGKYENYDSDTLSMIDMTKKIYISKTDITNGEELPGASITITDADGNEVVPGWTSTDKPHSIDILNFEPGTEYYFTEITAPDGYEVAETIVFKLDEDGRIYVKDSDGQFKLLDSDTIVMKDEPVTESDEPVEPTPTPTPTPETSVKTPTTTETSTATASTNVKTGDNVPLKAVAAMMVVSLLTLIGMGIYRKLDIKDDED